MSQQTQAQVRIADPVLTTHARRARNSASIGTVLMPRVYVDAYAGLIIKFRQEDFTITPSKRAPGSNIKAVQAGYDGDPYALQSRSLCAQAPVEHQIDAAKIRVNKLQSAINVVIEKQDLELEYDTAQMLRNPANHAGNTLTLAAGARWTQATSTPLADVDNAKESIRKKIGMYPNTMAVSPNAFKALKAHASIVDRFKYTSPDSITAQMLANLFELDQLVVGKKVIFNDATQQNDDVWGDDAVLAYVAPQAAETSERDRSLPSLGYTYTLDRMPVVEEAEYNSKTRSWEANVHDDCVPVLAAMGASFLFVNAGQS